jgi:heme/copper-type cytochrome/quinol oxidase subunit 2
VRAGEPVGGVRKLRVEKGEEVRFAVTADVAEEVHVHGYELFEDVRPGRPARLRFEAGIEGIFEIELEGSHTPIAELRVEP